MWCRDAWFVGEPKVTALSACDGHVCMHGVQGIAANLVTMFKDTSLVGLSALLSAFLHPAASAAPRFWPGEDAAAGGGSSPPALLRHGRGAGAPALPPPPPAELLPAKLLPAALSAMRALNGILLLARREVQNLLAAPDLSSELLFVLEAVVTLCTARWPGDDGVVRPCRLPPSAATPTICLGIENMHMQWCTPRTRAVMFRSLVLIKHTHDGTVSPRQRRDCGLGGVAAPRGGPAARPLCCAAPKPSGEALLGPGALRLAAPLHHPHPVPGDRLPSHHLHNPTCRTCRQPRPPHRAVYFDGACSIRRTRCGHSRMRPRQRT